MDAITTQLAGAVHSERLREADRARLAVSARKHTCRTIRQCMHLAREQAIIGYVYWKRG
jgi:hypothetical protein